MTYHKLTDEEAAIILHKGTEWPGSGEYDAHFKNGIYCCRQCGEPLYLSNAKFHSGCGWPSFEAEIPGKVERHPDKDGRRVEIVCSHCQGHLGHVFNGENYTILNTRHCVNSISLRFFSVTELLQIAQKGQEQWDGAVFAGGCFWGVEYLLSKTNGVLATEVGYAGGHTEHPSYQAVCRGGSGHAEVVAVIFDPKILSYQTLLKLFFEIHDPTQRDQQGPDHGHQYRSEVFYLREDQQTIAQSVCDTLQQLGFHLATHLTPLDVFWPAENGHQKYYEKSGGEPYCHTKVKRFLD